MARRSARSPATGPTVVELPETAAPAPPGLHADLEMLVNVDGREPATVEYPELFRRSGLRLTRTLSLGAAPEAMGHQLIEARADA